MSFSRSAIAANAQKPCSEPRCPNKRQNGTLTRRCRFHNNQRRTHQIRPSLLRPFRAVAARFIKAHQNDEQMILALSTLRELLEPGEEPQSRVSHRWARPEDAGKRGNWNPDYLVWKRLVLLQRPLLEPVHGGCKPGQPREYRRRPAITPEEVLREMLTVFLLTENYPDFLRDDGKPLSVEVARRAFKLRPSGKSNTNSKTPAYTACVAFGERLRNSPVWVFMLVNLETIKQEDAASKERKAKLYTPITPRVPERTKLLTRDISNLHPDAMTPEEFQIAADLVRKHGLERWQYEARKLVQEKEV